MNESEFLAEMERKGVKKTGHAEYAPDMDASMHSHDFAFDALVLEGRFTLSAETESRTIGPGDTWSLEAGVLHAEKVEGGAPVKFVYGVA
jgi:quercetin dioxygenase-like cupin family protein